MKTWRWIPIKDVEVDGDRIIQIAYNVEQRKYRISLFQDSKYCDDVLFEPIENGRWKTYYCPICDEQGLKRTREEEGSCDKCGRRMKYKDIIV